MELGKQANVLSKHQQNAVLIHLKTTRHPQRNLLIFLLSITAGLKATEIANLSWGMIMPCDDTIANKSSLSENTSSGKNKGMICMNKDLKEAFTQLKKISRNTDDHDNVIITERRMRTSPQCIVNLFREWYTRLDFKGCRSHAGRRTFIMNTAQRNLAVGGSLHDIQTYVEARKKAAVLL